MSLYLGIMLFSLIFTGLALIPFIDYIYKTRLHTKPDPLSRPLGGGIVVVASIVFLFATIFPLVARLGVFIESNFPVKSSTNIIFLTLAIFGLLGLFFDLKSMLGKDPDRKTQNQTLIFASLFIASLLNFSLKLDYVNIPHLAIVNLGFLYIPLAGMYLLLFIKGFEKADELDGLLGGSSLITLLAFWLLSSKDVDTPLAILIAVICGAVIAFLYFNIFPARIRMGKTGSYCLGALVGVLGLMLGKPLGLLAIGILFGILPILSLAKLDLLQVLRKRGWSESKIVMRLWLFTLLSSVMGLWLA